ncbi:hypothetical protein M427DRAFT_59171 [Gonapodya prolifera JEL478]|uniref:SH3 domain-containing protein n=1 Tax=Gonapodya prolifera (strain JEL478) TaxID=1344416 RepID=A0A139A847_GONPJ|nr:hypothetical protein M427DRAFT_59171 [Gonapodya prolifera JEL478]|eukprot:KXS12858.1 hypothetical protein M427DRAFT_59171 [Gonapodya prolifera JEL478]
MDAASLSRPIAEPPPSPIALAQRGSTSYNSIAHHLPLLLLLTLFASPSLCQSPDCATVELLYAQSSLTPPWPKGFCCGYLGPSSQLLFVGCDESNRTSSILLTSAGLSGPLPPGFASMTSLTTLYLSNNNISGALPDLSPIAPKLQYLLLDGNAFSGPVPSWLTNATSLTALHLQGNDFSGTFPNLSAITTLSVLYTHENEIEGNMDGKLPKTLTACLLRVNGVVNNKKMYACNGDVPKPCTSLSPLPNSGPECPASTLARTTSSAALLFTTQAPPSASASPAAPIAPTSDTQPSPTSTSTIVAAALGSTLFAVLLVIAAYVVHRRRHRSASRVKLSQGYIGLAPLKTGDGGGRQEGTYSYYETPYQAHPAQQLHSLPPPLPPPPHTSLPPSLSALSQLPPPASVSTIATVSRTLTLANPPAPALAAVNAESVSLLALAPAGANAGAGGGAGVAGPGGALGGERVAGVAGGLEAVRGVEDVRGGRGNGGTMSSPQWLFRFLAAPLGLESAPFIDCNLIALCVAAPPANPPDELPLQPSERVTLLAVFRDGWALARSSRGAVGAVPVDALRVEGAAGQGHHAPAQMRAWSPRVESRTWPGVGSAAAARPELSRLPSAAFQSSDLLTPSVDVRGALPTPVIPSVAGAHPPPLPVLPPPPAPPTQLSHFTSLPLPSPVDVSQTDSLRSSGSDRTIGGGERVPRVRGSSKGSLGENGSTWSSWSGRATVGSRLDEP